MVNELGVNGYGEKTYPPDALLKDSLVKYARRGLTQTQKLARLASDHGLDIKKTKLNQLERRFNIASVRRQDIPEETIIQSIIDEVQKDTQQNNGPNYIKAKLKDKDVHVPRDTIRKVMHEHFPDGPEKCYPGNRKVSKVNRQPLSALGPYHEVSADGHEKIGAMALQMEGLGLPIYGYRDKWTGQLILLDVIPDSRSPGTIGHVYIDFLERLGGAPLQLDLDKGTEIGWQVAMQIALRDLLTPDIDQNIYKAVALLKSIHNIIIESLWRWLRQKSGLNIREVLLYGKTERLIKYDIEFQRHLFYWIFVPLVQTELNEFCVYWNQRTVRYQVGKDMPSGHVPDDAAEHPELFGGVNCLIRVPKDIIDNLRDELTEQVGPREKFRSFYPDEFGILAAEVYDSIGRPSLSFFTAWEVFSKMSATIELL